MFAGRGIALPPWWITLAAVLGAFALGIGAGWATGQVPGWWEQRQEASASPSPSASSSATPTPTVSVAPVEPIDRELDQADRAAGLTTLDLPTAGDGTFTPAPGITVERDGAGPVRYVRIDVEDGVTMDDEALVDFVMDTLNDPRGWGSAGRQQFVLTDGVPDVRVVFASPATVATECPYSTAGVAAVGAAPEQAPEEGTCAGEGIAPVNVHEWAAGLDSFGDDRTGARQFLLQHAVGGALGYEPAVCEAGRASVMSDQRAIPEPCLPNPWPFADAGVPAEGSEGS